MRYWIVVLLSLLPSLWSTTDAQALSCPNKPASATTLATIHFTTSDGEGQLWELYPGAGQIQSPSGAEGTASASILAAGQSAGGQQTVWPKPGGQQALNNTYVCFRWKMNSQFVGLRTGNKLVFLAAQDWTFGRAGINGVFFVNPRGSYPPSSFQMIFGPNSSYRKADGSIVPYDNSHTCTADFGLVCGPNINDTVLVPDVWYTVEAYGIASTCPTCQNGTIKWWINNVLQGSRTNMNYGDTILNQFQINHTWDNSTDKQCGPPTNPSNTIGRDCRFDQIHYFDELVVAAVSGTPPPTPNPDTPAGPPAAPTGVNAQKVTQ